MTNTTPSQDIKADILDKVLQLNEAQLKQAIEVIKLIKEGYTLKEICDKLGLEYNEEKGL